MGSGESRQVIETYDHLGVDLGSSRHELVHEFLLFRNRDTLGTHAQVEWILEVVLVRGAAVQDDREGFFGVDAGSSRVQGQFSNLMQCQLEVGTVWDRGSRIADPGVANAQQDNAPGCRRR